MKRSGRGARPPGEAGDGGEAFPVGSVYLAVVSTNPATLLGYGTWSALGAGRVLMGVDAGQSGEETGGSASHSHAGHSDHAALTHSGATVGTTRSRSRRALRPCRPRALRARWGHGRQPHRRHATTSTSRTSTRATTGGAVGYAALKDTITSGSEARPSRRPTRRRSAWRRWCIPSARQPPTATTPRRATAPSGGAVDAHTVGQANQHAAQSHSAHDSVSHLPPFLAVYIWKRTA